MLPPSIRTAASPNDIKGHTFENIFEGTGSTHGVGVAINHVCRGGTICLLGNPSADVSITQKLFGQLPAKGSAGPGIVEFGI